VFLYAGFKVFNVVVGEVRCLEFADVKFEAIEGIE
jgi:hypothetical protein